MKPGREKNGVLSPGRALDALVAKKVMGLRPFQMKQDECFGDIWHYKISEPKTIKTISGDYFDNGIRALPYYSTDFAAAWEVVEKLSQSPHWSFGLVFDGTQWVAGMGAYSEDQEVKDYYRFIFHCFEAKADTAPHAICLAALEAMTKV